MAEGTELFKGGAGRAARRRPWRSSGSVLRVSTVEVTQLQFIDRVRPSRCEQRQVPTGVPVFLDKVVGEPWLCNDRCSRVQYIDSHAELLCIGVSTEAFGRILHKIYVLALWSCSHLEILDIISTSSSYDGVEWWMMGFFCVSTPFSDSSSELSPSSQRIFRSPRWLPCTIHPYCVQNNNNNNNNDTNTNKDQHNNNNNNNSNKQKQATTATTATRAATKTKTQKETDNNDNTTRACSSQIGGV